MRCKVLAACVAALGLSCNSDVLAQSRNGAETYRLYDGITAYVYNPDGLDFSIHLEIRDINLFAHGPREVLFKVYDPDGRPVVREVLPDDGVTEGAFPDAIGGWCDEFSTTPTSTPKAPHHPTAGVLGQTRSG